MQKTLVQRWESASHFKMSSEAFRSTLATEEECLSFDLMVDAMNQDQDERWAEKWEEEIAWMESMVGTVEQQLAEERCCANDDTRSSRMSGEFCSCSRCRVVFDLDDDPFASA